MCTYQTSGWNGAEKVMNGFVAVVARTRSSVKEQKKSCRTPAKHVQHHRSRSSSSASAGPQGSPGSLGLPPSLKTSCLSPWRSCFWSLGSQREHRWPRRYKWWQKPSSSKTLLTSDCWMWQMDGGPLEGLRDKEIKIRWEWGSENWHHVCSEELTSDCE